MNISWREVAFRGYIEGPGIEFGNQFRIWKGTPGSLIEVVRARGRGDMKYLGFAADKLA